jgi:hypothetical protein
MKPLSIIQDYCKANPGMSHGSLASKIFKENPGVWKCAEAIRASVRRIRTNNPDFKSSSTPIDEAKEGVSFQEDKESAVLSSNSRSIRSLEDLLAYSKVDMTIWEVDKYIVNQWDMGRKDKQTDVTTVDGVSTGHQKDSGKITVQPLFQIKIWLKRKEAVVQAIEQLLELIGKKAVPLTFSRQRPDPQCPKRSLELCLMDLHLGLLCQQPEADAPWDLDLAAESILSAVEDLIHRASVFAPFAEIVMPFGNDFVHSDNVFHTTTAGTGQPESIAWHRVYVVAERLAITVIERLRMVAPVKVYQIPGNHSRQTDFTLARLLHAYFRAAEDVFVDASSSPYKFHRCGVNLIGYEHGHSVKPIRLAGLMANECRDVWNQTEYHEWHLGDQHRKGSVTFEEQGVSVEYVPGLTAPNEWHRLKSYSHQKRGAMAYVWDWEAGPIARFQHNISKYSHKPLGK